jgi:site-specific DNA recombinase
MNDAGKPVEPLDLFKKAKKKAELAKPLNSVIYTRVSTTRQAEFGNSLDDQNKVCSRYCQSNNLKVLRLFVEPGVTGRTDKRPSFQEMITFCKRNAHKLAAVVVYDTSRIFRDTMQYLYYKKILQNLGIELLSPNTQRGNSPVHQLTDTTQAAFAQFESDLKSVRARLQLGTSM